MMATPNHTNYHSPCNNPDRNPLGSGELGKAQLGEIYASWNSEGDDHLTEAELAVQVLLDMGENIVGGLLMFAEHPNEAQGVVGGRSTAGPPSNTSAMSKAKTSTWSVWPSWKSSP